MKHILKKLLRIIPGLFIFALGIYLNGRSGLGYAPWNVLTDGAAKTIGITFGVSSIGLGVLIILIVIVLREPLGVGSVLNMILIGSFVDLLARMDALLSFVPRTEALAGRLAMCLASVLLTSVGTCIYMSTQWGAGPRDSLMVAVTRRAPLPYGACRAIIEGAVFLVGWALGGAVGVGTVINVLLLGPTIGFIFKIMRVDVKHFKNENFVDTWRLLARKGTPAVCSECDPDGR